VDDRLGVPRRLVVAVGLGILLNPLNSSILAVALVPLERYFGAGVATATWLQSAYYLAAAVGQPLMGRLADLYGPRLLFLCGLGLVLVASFAAPFAPGIWWLVAARAGQAFGGSVAYPAGLVILRRAAPAGRPPTGAIAVLSVVLLSSGALGPVLGGVLLALSGWRAVFWVNVPVVIAGIVTAAVVLPRSPARPRGSVRVLVAGLDVPGLLLFAATVASLLIALLSAIRTPHWWLLGVTAAGVVLLVLRERAVAVPFIDVRGLARNAALTSVLAQQATVNLIFYAMLLGLPVWLDAVRGLPASTIGIVLLPLNVAALVVMPVTARLVTRSGPRQAIVLGALLLLGCAVAFQLLGDTSPIAVLVVICVVAGIGDGLTFLALQIALYAASPANRAGGSGGLFQTFRYLGAVLATSLLGVVLGQDLSTAGLQRIGLVLAGAAALLALLARTGRKAA
jgi:MFS family permease